MTNDSCELDKRFLLVRLKGLLENAPDFSQYTQGTTEQLSWLGKATALIRKWNSLQASAFEVAIDFLHMDMGRTGSISKIMGTIHREIATMELEIENDSEIQAVFGPGAVYDFFNALTQVILKAEKELFIADPYLDQTIFKRYLNDCNPNVSVRLLVKKHAQAVKEAAELLIQQKNIKIEIRKSKLLHDRVVFVDGESCWASGQSLNDAAEFRVTYLAPLSADIVALKLPFYEDVWSSATHID